MAITNTTLVNFGYGVNITPSTTAGYISFDSAKQAIYVGDGAKANLVTSNVKDAIYVENKLTITKIDGSSFELNFADVASAKQTMAVFAALETAISNNTTAITTLSGHVDDVEAAYKLADSSIRTDFAAADASLDNRLKTVEAAVGEGGSVATQIATAIDALAGTAEDTDDSSFVKVAVATENGEVKTVTVTTNDIAKASDLSTHTGNGDIHVTKQQKEDWQAATDAINAFLDENAVSDNTVNTLKEIQEYITKDGSAAADMLDAIGKAQDTADQAVLDASAAQADVDALEITVGNLTTTVGNNKTAAEEAIALKADKTALQATDASLKTVTDSYVISVGGAKGAVTVKGGQATNGAVNLTMNGNELQASIVGLGSAAFTDSTAYDASGSAATAQTNAINTVTGNASDNSTAITLYGVKAYAKAYADDAQNAAQNAATVTGVDSTTKSDTNGYVTIGLALTDKNVNVASVSVDTQDVSTASASADGLATALNVKNYVDAKDSSMDARMTAVENQLTWKLL